MDGMAMLRMALQLSLTHRQGDTFFAAGQFDDAKATYLQEARKIVGQGYKIPGTGMITELYTKIGPFKRTNLMGCCVGMAKCLRRENKIQAALAWCEELDSLYRCNYHASEKPLYDWKDYIMDIPELSFLHVSGLCLASEILATLGNSGTAATRRWTALTTTVSLSDAHQTPELKAMIDSPRITKLCESRHPDPHASVMDGPVAEPALQVRGSWTRLQITKPGGVTEGRENFASWIWNSHLYVAGGRKTGLGPWYRDVWVLDLTKLYVWRQLPDYPVPKVTSGMFLGWDMLVHNDTALLFTGRPTVDVFDLRAETWGSFETTYEPTAADLHAGVVGGWTYPGRACCDTTMQIVRDKLYVFGGSHGTTSMGCNLFTELDLKTRKWRRLSGTVRVTVHGDYSCPGPRKSASSWVSPDKARIYLLFGSFDRQAAHSNNEPHGSEEAFGYADFWSWGIEEEAWRQERMAGNPPCSRTEMACVYNEKLQKAIVFGGYTPSLSTYVLTPGRQIAFEYSYFADTFVYDMPSSPSQSAFSAGTTPPPPAPGWRQVRTAGFPTYRCQAHLVCDPATGRTYMVGGWTNCQFIPTRTKLFSRSFGDVWELRVDAPGGNFAEADVKEEARVARAGPWQRCFACAAAGPWRKCGGSCKGRAFFCGSACLREGWKEHKQLHNCRKG
ncbi:hypothetical protein C8R43DRAFT_1048951 [Mycena crocata]|nr:hypothetical protein C8R43DRAFT_1048951 [Mycena crocata]